MNDPIRDYQLAVEHNLTGLDAVSTGLCPGCPECRSEFPDFQPEENWEHEGIQELWTVAAIHSPYYRIAFPTESLALQAAQNTFEHAWSTDQLSEDLRFSWSSCGICGSSLGGNRYSWHALDCHSRDLLHFDDACEDCVAYLANGDLPQR